MDKSWYIWGPVILAILVWLFIAVKKAEKGQKKDTALGCLVMLPLMGGLPLMFLYLCTSEIKWDGERTEERYSEGEYIIEKFNYLDGEKDGIYESWYKSNKQPKEKGRYDKGKKVGTWITWYKNGQMKTGTNFSLYNPHRRVTEWHENGQVRSKDYFAKTDDGKDDWIEPKTIEWYDNGQKRSEGHADKYWDGTSSEWHKNGQLYKKETWSGGKLVEIEITDDKGKPCPFTTYKNGTGLVARYYGPWSYADGPSRILVYENYEVTRVMDDN